MKIRFIFAAVALATASCGVNSGLNSVLNPSSTAAVCERTTTDEKAVIAVNLAYKGFRKAVEVGVNAGYIKGELAGRVAEADNKAFAAIRTVDTIYRTCSGDLATAVASASGAISAALATVPSGGR